VRRFNDAFRKTYGRSPRELRKRGNGERAAATATLTLRLPYREPFDWPAMLGFLAARATPGIEQVVGDRYRRTLAFDDEQCIVEVMPARDPGHLLLSLRSVPTHRLFDVTQRARDALDLDTPVGDIAKVLRCDPCLRGLLSKNAGVRVPGAWDGFELAVRAILGQQVSVRAATTLAGRIVERHGAPLRVSDDFGDSRLTRVFPAPAELEHAPLENIGMVGSRVETIRRLAAAVVRGEVSFDAAQDPEAFRAALCRIKGIGEWTAQYVAMRVLKYPDAFPASDLGLLKAVRPPERVSPAELGVLAERWRPWRAYAAMLLWGSLPGAGG
jgi:AraC family transcriptional regulator of adaptative response / DNA-3-methyladenine glycosylase II